MSIWKRVVAAVFSLMLVLNLSVGVCSYAEDGSSESTESSVIESSSELELEEDTTPVDKTEEKSSSSESSFESSSSSSSSIAEEDKYDFYSYSSSSVSRSMSSSSDPDDISNAYIIGDESTRTEVKIGLQQPNEDLVLNAEQISVSEKENKELFKVLSDSTKGKPIEYCFKLTLTGDDEFDSDVTVILPVDSQLIGREMNVISYDGNTASSRNISVCEYFESGEEADDSESVEPSMGIIKKTQRMTANKEYVFCICEIADFVPSSHGLGLLEVAAIVVGSLALLCGGFLTFLIIRDRKLKSKVK